MRFSLIPREMRFFDMFEEVAATIHRAAVKFLEFFAARTRNPNTREAYARACSQFLSWCAQHAHDMRVNELRNNLGLAAKSLNIVVREACMQQFDRRLCFQVHMLAKINFSESPYSQQSNKLIIPQALPDTL